MKYTVRALKVFKASPTVSSGETGLKGPVPTLEEGERGTAQGPAQPPHPPSLCQPLGGLLAVGQGAQACA